MKKYDFKKLVLMGVAGATLALTSVNAAGAYDDNTYTPSQTKKTTKNTKPTQKNTNANANYSSNARGYNYTAENSLATDPKPSPYRSAHPFDNRFATEDKGSAQGDDSNFSAPNAYGASNDQNRGEAPRQGNNNPQNIQNRGNTAPSTWNKPAPGKPSDELADDYNANAYQQRMGTKNWYGDNANPSSSAPSPRASDGVYYEDMTNNPNNPQNRRPINNAYGNNASQQQQYNAQQQQQQQQQQYNRAPQPQPVQGRIIHSDTSYHGGGSSGCSGGCGGGGGKR
ncbi:MAG: hypothetical protein WC222_06385 [Parachlamydiales bacterium]|jgi:hypothetical protein